MTYRILLAVLLIVAGSARARRLPSIYWNSSNTIFDAANTDHVMQVEIGDQLSVICPEPGPDYEFTQLYMVSDHEYNHCALDASNKKPKLIGACLDATRPASLSVVFRKYSPTPGGHEFHPGQTYYVISTSDGRREDLESREGGLCTSANMKVKFEVEPDRHHHSKAGHHEERGAVAVSPKFAARMVDSSRSSSSADSASHPVEYSTDGSQMEYIIHETTDGGEPGDVDASAAFSVLPTVLLLSIGYLLRQ